MTRQVLAGAKPENARAARQLVAAAWADTGDQPGVDPNSEQAMRAAAAAEALVGPAT